jgi:hypothetical protein
MGLFDKVKDLAGQHADKVVDAIDKVAEVVDEKTGGKYADQIAKGADAAKGLVADGEDTGDGIGDDPGDAGGGGGDGHGDAGPAGSSAAPAP